jgi:septal ring factor EnvC (AmiA/AmiB activator)
MAMLLWHNLNLTKYTIMKHYTRLLAPVVLAAVLAITSCAEKKTSTQEEIEIKSMDSTSKVIKENTEKLEDQTKKVEASLEKLDKEFENDNQSK